LYVRKNGNDFAESVGCCHIKYRCPGKQVARICAPLVENVQMINKILHLKERKKFKVTEKK